MAAPKDKPILEIKDLHVSYGAIKALRGVSLHVEEGEIVSVIGANGAGKSTLMQAIMAQVPREGGEIYLNDVPLSNKSFQVVSPGDSPDSGGKESLCSSHCLREPYDGSFSP